MLARCGFFSRSSVLTDERQLRRDGTR